MPKHKSEDYKKTAVEYYLFESKNQVKTCKIFKCSRLRKMKGNSLTQLKTNVKTVLENIPNSIYKNIFKGSYKREVKYTPKKTSKIRKLKKYKL